MLLFVNGTGEDIVYVFDADTLERLGKVEYIRELHDDNIGPRAGVGFKGMGVVANCYDNTLSLIDTHLMKEIKVIRMGAYPVAIGNSGENILVACGDSDSIWAVNAGFEVSFVESTVKFPFCMAVGEDEVCVCGFNDGEVCIYDRESMEPKEYFSVNGYPMGAAYVGNELLIAYNGECDGMIYFRDKDIRIGARVGKAVSFDGKCYICVDDNRITAIDENSNKVMDILVQDAIGDFAVGESGIFASMLLKGNIIKFSHTGEFCGKIIVECSAGGLFLLS